MRNRREQGSVILDTIVSIALFTVLFTGFFALMQLGVKTLTEHKARAGALAIGRSHIEYIRSLDYAAVGVQGGNPSGALMATTAKVTNSIQYTIATQISWHDDAGDGLGGADSNPRDYKNLRVEVAWPEHAGVSGGIVLSTIIADYEAE